MMEISAATPDVDGEEYVRLLGFPRGHRLEGRALELAEWARGWYAAHGRPWTYARVATDLLVAAGTVTIEGLTLRSGRLHRTLDEAGASSAALVAVSAGPELELEAQRAWTEGRPDEYFFLEMLGSAVVEHLTMRAGATLCAWAEGEGMAVLPHDSPGYPEWDVADNARLLTLLGDRATGGRLEVLESGMLRPKKSLLAVFGVTRQVGRVDRTAHLVPCRNCSFTPCQYRRAPYARTTGGGARRGAVEPAGPAPAYGVNRKALARWAGERLSMTESPDGTVDALFRYDGTTCSNTGRPLAFHYRVTLGPREEGYPIRQQSCAPAPGDDGYRAMCEYIRSGDRLIEAIGAERPLLGSPLDAVLSWTRPTAGPGCYCDGTSREHKWGLVLETIHYALARGGDGRGNR